MKNKINKDNFEKNHIKIEKKNHVGKHYSNPQCFVRKATFIILTQLNNKKIDKDNFGKNHKKKPCWETL